MTWLAQTLKQLWNTPVLGPMLLLLAMLTSILGLMWFFGTLRSRKKRSLSFILAEFGGAKALGKISSRAKLYVCPVCFLLSPEKRLCPNHDFPVQMELGSFDKIEFYEKKQQLLQTEIPDEDDDGRPKRPWE